MQEVHIVNIVSNKFKKHYIPSISGIIFVKISSSKWPKFYIYSYVAGAKLIIKKEKVEFREIC